MKYKKGEFGYWWTEEMGNADIEGKVRKGNIYCSHQGLTSLRGAPKTVHGCFDCSYNKLTTLKGAPEEVDAGFYCTNNKLTTLKYAPKKVGDAVWCAYNNLTTLKGAPRKLFGFDCSYNKLTSLEGAPEEVSNYFLCTNNILVSLKGAPRGALESFDCRHNKLTTLEGAPNVAGYFSCTYNNLSTLECAPKMANILLCDYNELISASALAGIEGLYRLRILNNPNLTSLPNALDIHHIDICGDTYKWRGSTWSFFDGVRKEVSKIRKSGSLTVYQMRDGTYAVHDGEAYAHGETLKEAKKDLIYKKTSRDTSEYESLTLDSKLPLEECIKMYRSITGACSLGTKEFCQKRKLKKAYTVREVIELTEGEYGNEKLKEFFYGVRNESE